MRSIREEKADPILVGIIMTLIVFGLVMISSAGVIYSQTRFGDDYYFFKHQLFFGVIPGLIIMYILQKVDYHFWKKMAVPLFFVSIVLLVLVFVPGIGSRVYGASRWIQLGPFSFQPSEMAKLTIILYLAAWLESRGAHRIKDFFEGMIPFLGIMGLVGFLIMKQPDTGTLGVIVLSSIAIFFVAGARVQHLLSLGGIGFCVLWLLVKLEPYRFDRILAFQDPTSDPQGIGYQIMQALIAVEAAVCWGSDLATADKNSTTFPNRSAIQFLPSSAKNLV